MSARVEAQLVTTDYRMQFKAAAIVITEVKEWFPHNPTKPRTKQLENLKHNRTRGILSDKSRKRLQTAINWLVLTSSKKVLYSLKINRKMHFKLNFMTLTIPPQKEGHVTEKAFKHLLNTFLTYHRKYSCLNNYIWKIETHKDGRFHIHLTSDTFIHHQQVRRSWNTILQRQGLLEFHFEKFGTYSPPSTEVKAVKDVRNLGAYLSKYMSKTDGIIEGFKGRVWGCSRKISKVLDTRFYISPEKMGEVMRPILETDCKEFIVETEPNKFGNTYRVATVYIMELRHWLQLQGNYVYEAFKELVVFLRAPGANQLQLQYQK